MAFLPLAHPFRIVADHVKYSRGLALLRSRALAARASSTASIPHRLALLARAYALAEEPGLEGSLAAQIHAIERSDSTAKQAWTSLSAANSRYLKALARTAFVNRGVLLKPPGPNGEKGVILTTFEYNWIRILRGVPDWTRLEDQYDIIFSNSWSPSDYAVVREVLARLRGDMFVQTNNRGDIPRLARMDSRLHAVPTIASDWIHPGYYHPKPFADRAYDIAMVANWAPFKRHWEFFAALRRLPSHWRILLIGQPDSGRTISDVQALARQYGVRQEITWHERLEIDEVSALQVEARITVVLSRREGACVAVAEALLADSPVALRADAHLGSRIYINNATGLFLRSGNIAADICTLWERAPSLSPRAWAIQHASAHAAHEALNSFMRAASIRRGLPWTRDLARHCWRPYPSLLPDSITPEHRDSVAALAAAWPEVFSQNLATTAEPPSIAPVANIPDAPLNAA